MFFEYAKDPDVGPIAGWPCHKNVEESRGVIKNVLSYPECYAICQKDDNIAIGSIELKLNGNTAMTNRDDECELGYWLGKPFWGKGYIYPELISKPTSFSFPSGHTASAFAAAIALLWHNRKFGIPITIFAALMGFSRIYVEVHYCTDVIAGVISGTICAFVAVLIVKYLFPVVDKGLDKLYLKLKKNKAD